MSKEKNVLSESHEEADSLEPSRGRLIEVLESLEKQIKRQTSLKFIFLRGAIYGLGTVIGATILIALLGGLVASTLSSVQDWPFIGEYIDGQYIEDVPH